MNEHSPHIVRRIITGCIVLTIILTLVAAFDVSYGESNISLSRTGAVICSHIPLLQRLVCAEVSDMDATIIWQIRVPRALLALLVGAMLAMAGAALQGLLLNPLADPYTVGVSSGAALGAGVATLTGLASVAGGYGVSLVAFVFAMGAMMVVYAVARSAGRVSIHSFLLAGIVVGSFLWAILSFVLALAAGDPAEAQGKIIQWLLGSFNAVDPWGFVRLAAPFALFGLIALLAFARDLNLFAMGEESAQHLGIETENLKIIILAVASLITAAAVSVSGIIGFVGLVVPHICRKVFGSDHRALIPTAALAGASLTVLADLVSRVVLPPSGLPVGIVTAMLGAPFFLYLLRTSKG
ncbi:MAG: iron chelate uptake ABC transporter family permease subunit [Armatimonadetes bacterium]|jgi:iron complex transport system permease protein|nr:iron chelate uptake ABC transporter family permease subunit [Armatimonadota bacterium]